MVSNSIQNCKEIISEVVMTLVDNHKLIFLFIKMFVGFFCAFFTVSYIIYENLTYIKIIVVSLLFALTMLYRERKKRLQNTKE